MSEQNSPPNEPETLLNAREEDTADLIPVSDIEALETDLADSLNTALEAVKPRTLDLEQYFSFLGTTFTNDIYKGLTLTPTQLERAKNHMISMKHGTYASTPLICQGHKKCPIIHQCFFAERDEYGDIKEATSKFPLLRPCPVETNVLQIKIQQYLSQFVGDKNIAMTPTVLALVTKIAELDIYEVRCNAVLSRGDRKGEGTDLLATTIEAINERTGDVIKGVKEHPVLAIKERLGKQRESLMKQLLATPEARFNADVKAKRTDTNSDLSSKLADLSSQIDRIESKQAKDIAYNESRTINVPEEEE